MNSDDTFDDDGDFQDSIDSLATKTRPLPNISDYIQEKSPQPYAPTTTFLNPPSNRPPSSLSLTSDSLNSSKTPSLNLPAMTDCSPPPEAGPTVPESDPTPGEAKLNLPFPPPANIPYHPSVPVSQWSATNFPKEFLCCINPDVCDFLFRFFCFHDVLLFVYMYVGVFST